MNNLPEFKSSFLTEITKSFFKVRKSLKYNSHDVKFNKVIETIDSKKLEKVELSIRSSLSRNSIKIRLYIWADRWLWIDARKSKKDGWEWEYTFEGRLSGLASERDLMEALKAFNKSSITYTEDSVAKESDLHWMRLIATGPKALS